MNRPSFGPTAFLAAMALNCGEAQKTKIDPFQAKLEERVIDYTPKKPQEEGRTKIDLKFDIALPEGIDPSPEDTERINEVFEKCVDIHRGEITELAIDGNPDKAKELVRTCIESEIEGPPETVDPKIAELNTAIEDHLTETRTNCDKFISYIVEAGAGPIEPEESKIIKIDGYQVVVGDKMSIIDSERGAQVNVTMFNQMLDGKPVAGFSVGELCATTEAIEGKNIKPDTSLDVSQALQERLIIEK